MTARTQTRQRREKMLQMRRGTVGIAEEQLPIKRQVAHKICSGLYPSCVCSKTTDRPVCDRMEGLAQHVIDLVRRYDLKARESGE